MHVKETSMLGGVFALPWCCLVPAGFALLGVAGVSLAREFSMELMPYLLGLSVLFLGRAHYVLYVQHQGNRLSHLITWLATGLAATMLPIQVGM